MSNEERSVLGRIPYLARLDAYIREEVDARYRELRPDEREEVERHNLGARVSHWALVLLMLVLTVTGGMIWLGIYWPFGSQTWGGYYNAFGLHMWAGILVLPVGFILLPYFYYLHGHGLPIIGREAILENLAIVTAFVGLRRYIPNYHTARMTYDRLRNEWLAEHPAQQAFFYVEVLLTLVLALTGFAMYDLLGIRTVPIWIEWFAALKLVLAFETIKQIHLLSAFALVAATLMHAYFAMLPSNWPFFVSMFTGTMEANVVDGEDADTSVAASDGGTAVDADDAD